LRQNRQDYLDRPCPGGESRRQAVRRLSGLLADLPARWDGPPVLLIGHVATQHALENCVACRVVLGRSAGWVNRRLLTLIHAFWPAGWHDRLKLLGLVFGGATSRRRQF
jgi:broad specificity phosphatase PhoE